MRSVVWVAVLLLLELASADQLLLVQAIWRHGDRNLKYICPNDPNSLDSWYQGLGQITANGEKQHFDLGRMIYDEYATKAQFLGPAYDADEIYMRSTDVNLTLLSAYSNLMGMYFNRSVQIADVNYPAIAGWPSGFVPVPVHTVSRELDHIGYTEPNCPRQKFLFEMIQQTPEYQNYVQQMKETMHNANYICGVDLTIFDIWRLTDAYLIELHHNRTNKIIDAAGFQLFRAIEFQSENFKNGQGVKPLSTNYGTIDFSKEILTVRSGGLIRDMIDHMDHKHWATLNALFIALGARDKILPNQLPDFAATFIIELWKTTAGGYSITARYYDGPGYGIRNVTHLLPGCSSDMCPYEQFKQQPMKFYPQNIDKLCNDVPANWKQEAEHNAENTLNRAMKRAPERKVLRRIVKRQAAATNELLFIQAFWRHGDRTPTSKCPNDKNGEETWPEGYGQLTALGMAQQRRLGSLIYQKYVNEMKFLNGTYDARQIYIRSTDFNRTIISGISNFVGMYYDRPASLAGRDFPEGEWPEKFISVPIHTVNRFTDHMGDPNTPCPRQLALMDIAINSNETRFLEQKNQAFLDEVSKICGKKIGIMDLVMPVDTWYIENIHNRTKLFTDEMYAKMRELDRVAENVRHGLLTNSVHNGIDLRVEIPKLRGGSQLWNVIDHMEQKIYCLQNPGAPESQCGWYKDLKYFAFSAHDSTLNGLLSAMGAKERVVPDDIPEYTAAVVFELWSIGGQYKIKASLT
ncbi:Prostatic acid phosphatase [Toxocara canis]|uniref:Prostatic acid phosphatase n=1 Tax=Toxocara canis TaxID=6265 RepID=A0A0B2VCN3_TOXCA|nr:Prostatic acid phosphatase [Toxocara canis]